MTSKISEGGAWGWGMKRHNAVCNTRKARVQPHPSKETLGDLLPGFPTLCFPGFARESFPQLQAPLSPNMAWEAGWQSPLVVRISNDSRQARCSKQGSWVPDKAQEVEIFSDALGLPCRMPNRRTEPTSFHKPETAALGGYQEHGDSDP